MYEIFLKLLNERNLKAADVCRETGLPSSLFSEWKRGKSTPKTDKMLKIADFFGVTVNYLTTGEEGATPRNLLSSEDEQDIATRITQALKDLESQSSLLFDGAPMDSETREILMSGLENSIRTAKINARKRIAAYAEGLTNDK